MTRREEVLRDIQSFTIQGVGVTRQTLAGALTQPINTVTARVRELILAGDVVEKGAVSIEGRPRKLLWAAGSA